jgi:hypothetical protein
MHIDSIHENVYQCKSDTERERRSRNKDVSKINISMSARVNNRYAFCTSEQSK